MRAILGIGNPGIKYEFTRHNAGFIILDLFAKKYSLQFSPSKYDYYIAGSKIKATQFFLIKPTTYVNLSGIAAKDFVTEKSINIEDLLVIVDDINLELGKIRLRKKGGSGGHNGLESLIYHLESDDFPRLRFGIGSDFDKGNQADYVLSKFSEEEFQAIENSLNFSVDLIKKFITGGTKNMLDYLSKNSEKLNNPTP